MADTGGQRAAALAVLGLAADATPAEVTSAYRRLARATHPDRSAHDDAGARFALLAEAYRRARQVGEAPAPDAVAPPGPDVTPTGVRPAAPRSAKAATASMPPIVAGPVRVTLTDRARPRPWWDVWEETW